MSPWVWIWASTGHRLAMARAALGVAVVVALAVAGLSLLDGLGRALQGTLASEGGELRVRAPSLSIGGLDLAGSVVPGKLLDEAALAELAAIGGVADAQPEAWARVPLTFTGGFAGQHLRSEGALLGVEAAGVGDPAGWDWAPGQPVPVLAPAALLAVYNGSFAPTNGLPRLTERAIIGLDFDILAGRSLYGRSTGAPVSVPAEVIGTTTYGGALAAIVPLAAVRWLETEAGVSEPGRLSSARLVLAPDASPDAVEAQVRALGWAVERGDGAIEKLAALSRSVQLGIGATAAVLALSMLVGVAQLQGALIRARAEEIAVLRALGVPALRAAAGLLGEVLLSVGLASGLGALSGALAADALAVRSAHLVSGWIGLDVRVTASLPPLVWIAALLGPALTAGLLVSPAVLSVVRARALYNR